jgi:hypothetical protein
VVVTKVRGTHSYLYSSSPGLFSLDDNLFTLWAGTLHAGPSTCQQPKIV